MEAVSRRRSILALALAGVAMLVGLLFATNSKAEIVESYCSPNGDYCTAVSNVKGRPKLEILTVSFDTYSVCMKGQGIGDCVENIQMRPDSEGIYSSKVDILRKFHPNRAGKYKAGWFVGDTQIGKTLKFSLGAGFFN
jgi:hypothetical protein